jgi:hypothetical protein
MSEVNESRIWSFTMKHLVVAVVMATMAVVTTEVRANNITYSGSLLPINVIAAVHTDSSYFTDTFTFNGTGSYIVPASSIFEIVSNIGLTPQTNINFTSVTLNGYALNLGSPGIYESVYNTSPFSFNGRLTLEVKGTTGATGTGLFRSSVYGGVLTARSVPEPASLLLLGAGLAGIGIWRRKVSKG